MDPQIRAMQQIQELRKKQRNLRYQLRQLKCNPHKKQEVKNQIDAIEDEVIRIVNQNTNYDI